MLKGLYDTFAKNWYHGGGVNFYSDPHFSDLEAYKLRFPDKFKFIGQDRPSDEWIISQLDEMQVKNINSKTTKLDTLVILGDIGNIEYVKRLRGYKVLIMGNHDSGATNYKRVIEIRKAPFKINKSEIKAIEKSWGIIDGPGDWAAMQTDIEKYINKCIVAEFEKNYKTADTRLIYNNKNIKTEYFEDQDQWYFYYKYDNNLFDEVYEGSLQISPKIMISHEPHPVNLYPYMINVCGHDHSCNNSVLGRINVCAENTNYFPIPLKSIVESGKLKNIVDMHRITIDNATLKKAKKHAKQARI